MDQGTIEDRLIEYIASELLRDSSRRPAAEDELLLDGVIDSIGATRLVGFVEDAWQLAVPAQDVTVENFGSVRQIATYVRSKHDG